MLIGRTAQRHLEVVADSHRPHDLIDRQPLAVVSAAGAADQVAGHDRAFVDPGWTSLQSTLLLPDDFALPDRRCVFNEDATL